MKRNVVVKFTIVLEVETLKSIKLENAFTNSDQQDCDQQVHACMFKLDLEYTVL